MSRDAMQCHVMCTHVKSYHVLSPAMGWNVMSLKRHYSLNNYSVLQSTTKYYYSVLQSTTTPNYKVLLQYYSELQSTTPVQLQY